MASGGVNIYGELLRAQLEQIADPSPALKSRIFWSTTNSRPKIDTGSLISAFLLNDQNMVMGTNATAANNVRWNRAGNAVLELLIGSDSTAEGSSNSANWAKLNTKLGGSLVDTYQDFTEIVTPANPASGSRRVYVKADGKLYTKNSSGTEAVVGGGTSVLAVTSKTANYNVASSDDFVSGNASGGSFTLTLPDATLNTGKVFYLKRADQTLANTITIATTSAQTIDGASSQSLVTQHEEFAVVSDGSNWQILTHKIPSSWTTYSLTITGSTTNPVPSGVTTNSATWRREGDSIRIRYQFTQPIPGGTAGSGDYKFSLPSGLTIDTTKILIGTNVFNIVGLAHASSDYTGDVNNSTTEGHMFVYDSTHLGMRIFPTTSALVEAVLGSANFSLATSMVYKFDALVPISGWGG